VGGLGLTVAGLGFAGYNQYQACVADDNQFGSNFWQTAAENGVTIGGPPLIGGGGNYGDGVDGAPTGIDVPRWSLSQSI